MGKGKEGRHDNESEENVEEYAAFLREKERKCGPDGYIDSRRYQKSFQLQAAKKDQLPRKDQGMITVLDASARTEKDQRDFDKRVKLIEDHMWQHKQEERELKRVEGDITKNQRAVRKALRDYENSITKKKMSETIKLNQSLDTYAKEQIVYNKKRDEISNSRMQDNIQAEQTKKGIGRKTSLTTSHLARQYNTKLQEMELKKSELSRISKDFETKLRLKEEEQFSLKQELAELALKLNMESQKGRSQEQTYNKEREKLLQRRKQDDHSEEVNFENKQAKSATDIKQTENQRRRLSASLALTRSHLGIKHREEGRHLRDTENRLRGNINVQKQLNAATLLVQLDHKAKQLDQKAEEHENRRKVIAFKELQQKKTQSTAHEELYAEKFKKRYADQVRREHEDGLKFFQKMVNKGEEREQALYSQVRSSEYARQKQEQVVKRLHKKLEDMKKENAEKIKSEMMERSHKEKELEQQLIREQALLSKVHAEREESYGVLQNHRRLLQEDKHLLSEHEREHQRLMRLSAQHPPASA